MRAGGVGDLCGADRPILPDEILSGGMDASAVLSLTAAVTYSIMKEKSRMSLRHWHSTGVNYIPPPRVEWSGITRSGNGYGGATITLEAVGPLENGPTAVTAWKVWWISITRISQAAQRGQHAPESLGGMSRKRARHSMNFGKRKPCRLFENAGVDVGMRSGRRRSTTAWAGEEDVDTVMDLIAIRKPRVREITNEIRKRHQGIWYRTVDSEIKSRGRLKI